jgi:hypothetical protein
MGRANAVYLRVSRCPDGSPFSFQTADKVI